MAEFSFCDALHLVQTGHEERATLPYIMGRNFMALMSVVKVEDELKVKGEKGNGRAKNPSHFWRQNRR